MSTVQVHNYNYCNQDHNLRKGAHAEMPHTDPEKTKQNEVWGHTPVKQAYHEIFDEAMTEYNAKQKRNDRKIQDYYKKIEEDKNKHVDYEVVVGVYHPANKKGELYDLDAFTEKQAHDAIKEYYDTWPERNPTLKLIGGYYHVDEIGQNHAHIGYIPVGKGAKEIKKGKAKGTKRGMSIENSLTNALADMGFVTKAGRTGTAQQQWQRREAEVFEKICNKHGIFNIRHPRKEKKERKGLDMTDYKRVKAIENKAEIALEKAEQARQAAADERAAAEQSRQEAERAAAEQTARLAREAQEHTEQLRQLHEKEEAKIKAKKEKQEKEAAERRDVEEKKLNEIKQQQKEVKEELALQNRIIESQKTTILENEDIFKKTDDVLTENKWLNRVIDAVEWAFPKITPLLNAIFNYSGKYRRGADEPLEPMEIAEAWVNREKIEIEQEPEEQTHKDRDEGQER